MPPAFNLSQDQTLQFNPTNSQFTDGRFLYLDNFLPIRRVIALILFATRVASHQSTHTYRLFNLLKSSAAPSLLPFRRQQQRSEIMKHFV